VHVYLEWAPATSLRECKALVRLAEEAGVEIGVSRPLRFHAFWNTLPADFHATLISLSGGFTGTLLDQLADSLDLCASLSGSTSVQRIEAEAVRGEGARTTAVAFSLRFHNGAYAQVNFGQRSPEYATHLYLAGGDVHLDVDLGEPILTEPSISRENAGTPLALETTPVEVSSPISLETRGFVEAILSERTPPVTVLDGLHTMRLIERVMERLR